ncbi:hypothetical protein, partial [Yersinia pestis]|uniref:hypothetical protein n=1 Tax=Yersinia pestis TaxID=632 RepID=UPI0005785625
SKKTCRYQDFMQPLVMTLQDLISQAKQNRSPQVFRGLPVGPSGAPKKRKKISSKAKESKS